MAKLFANRGGPDQTPLSVASDLGLHSLPITPLGEVKVLLMSSKNICFCGERRKNIFSEQDKANDMA